MARYVIGPDVALDILGGALAPSPRCALLAPTVLRSEVLDTLYRRFRAGELPEPEAMAMHGRLARLKIRYLGDAVMRRRAWALAARAGLGSTIPAEYLALAQLQADALATADPALTAAARGLVPVAPPRSLA